MPLLNKKTLCGKFRRVNILLSISNPLKPNRQTSYGIYRFCGVTSRIRARGRCHFAPRTTAVAQHTKRERYCHFKNAVLRLRLVTHQEKRHPFTGCRFSWCGRQELNLHGVTHKILSLARLPVPPRPLIYALQALLFYPIQK